MTQYTVDKSFDLKREIMICERCDDSNALRVLAVKNLSTFMATDEAGEMLIVARYQRRYYPTRGDAFTGWIIPN